MNTPNTPSNCQWNIFCSMRLQLFRSIFPSFFREQLKVLLEEKFCENLNIRVLCSYLKHLTSVTKKEEEEKNETEKEIIFKSDQHKAHNRRVSDGCECVPFRTSISKVRELKCNGMLNESTDKFIQKRLNIVNDIMQNGDYQTHLV